MRNLLVLHLILVLCFLPVEAQENSSSVKIGYYNPSITDGGFIVGYEWRKYIDENFDIGGSIDWFKKLMLTRNLLMSLVNTTTGVFMVQLMSYVQKQIFIFSL